MLAKTIHILWHGKEAVYSVECEPGKNRSDTRVATCGGDGSVRIWNLSHRDTSKPLFEYVCSLEKHSGAVNCVRWHPQGSSIASGGDDSSIFIWRSADDSQKGTAKWNVESVLRGSSPDVYDLSWSPDGLFIAAASTDNTVSIFDIRKRRCIYVLSDHHNFVQGVCFDSTGSLLATQSCDQSVIVYSCPAKNGKMARPKLMVKLKRIGHDDLANSTIEAPEKSSSKIYHDESLTSFFRRLQFSPDGLLLVTPAAVSIRNAFSCVAPAQADSKKVNTSLVYGRNSLKSKIPLLELPVPSCRPTVTVKFSPIIYKLRKDVDPIIPLPYRMIFAVACQDAVIIYDTQQAPPIAATTGLHYATLTDIAWSDDGLVLIIASTDGFCSVLFFSQSDLGDEWKGSLMHPAPERPNVDRYTASQS